MAIIKLPWARKGVLVLFGLALFLPTAYGQLNNLELLEPSKPSGGSANVSADAASEPQSGSPSARIESPSTPVVLTENSSNFDVTFYIPEGFYQSKQQD